ncbi:hypothetical protein TRAPUB_2558 [Trametes pubescens]|uniref:Uncharacterized protein n=1 Tax=Trametes pubescens TaxID=154538 RepID=A0A1M2VG93_TRAPU|nr:hypothetical protein TRAPUB_2558 [Trametes pubescens]
MKSPESREQLQERLRTLVTKALRKRTRNEMADLHYSLKDYANLTVVRDKVKIVGWPSDLPFTNFNNVPGGIPSRRRLLALWAKGTLCLRPATREDIANAMRDPRSVHPSYRPGGTKPKLRGRNTLTLTPVVLEPSKLEPIGTHPTSTVPSAATLGDRARKQRIDTKKPRWRNFDSPYARARMLPRAGIKSSPNVLESESDTCDDSVVPSTGSSGSMKRGRSSYGRPVDDPLPEFLPFTGWATHTFLAGGTLSLRSQVFSGEVGAGTDGGEDVESDDPIEDWP